MKTIRGWLGTPPKLTYWSVLFSIFVVFMALFGLADLTVHRYYLGTVELELVACFIYIQHISGRNR
jgi:hypothetical protein